MTSWPPSWICDIKSNIRLRQSLHMHLMNNAEKFHPDPIWNNWALHFFAEVTPTTRRKTRWVAIWLLFLIYKWPRLKQWMATLRLKMVTTQLYHLKAGGSNSRKLFTTSILESGNHESVWLSLVQRPDLLRVWHWKTLHETQSFPPYTLMNIFHCKNWGTSL